MVQKSGALSFVYATNVADKSTHMSNGLASASRVPSLKLELKISLETVLLQTVYRLETSNIFLFVYLLFYYFY